MDYLVDVEQRLHGSCCGLRIEALPSLDGTKEAKLGVLQDNGLLCMHLEGSDPTHLHCWNTPKAI